MYFIFYYIIIYLVYIQSFRHLLLRKVISSKYILFKNYTYTKYLLYSFSYLTFRQVNVSILKTINCLIRKYEMSYSSYNNYFRIYYFVTYTYYIVTSLASNNLTQTIFSFVKFSILTPFSKNALIFSNKKFNLI